MHGIPEIWDFLSKLPHMCSTFLKRRFEPRISICNTLLSFLNLLLPCLHACLSPNTGGQIHCLYLWVAAKKQEPKSHPGVQTRPVHVQISVSLCCGTETPQLRPLGHVKRSGVKNSGRKCVNAADISGLLIGQGPTPECACHAVYFSCCSAKPPP